MIDRLLFKTGAEVVIVDADSWRTNAAKQAREEAENRGAIAVLREKHDEAEAIANELRATLFDRGVNLNDGAAQVRCEWTSSGVACKGFIDLLFLGGDDGTATIYDLKTCENAAPDALKLDLRSSLQAAAYVEAIETMHPEYLGRTSMKFIFAEADGADLTIAEPDGMLKSLGESRWRRAVQLWGECLKTSRFPGYPKEVARLAAKPWEMTEDFAAATAVAGPVPF